MEGLLSLAVKAIFVENLALSFFLGMCTFIAVSKNAGTWWKFAFESLMIDVRRRTKPWTPEFINARRANRLEYERLFEPVADDKSPSSDEQVREGGFVNRSSPARIDLEIPPRALPQSSCAPSATPPPPLPKPLIPSPSSPSPAS